MRRWTRRLTLVAPATLILAATGPLSAYASCPDLDIVCTVDEAVGAGEQLATDTITSLSTPAHGAADPVVDPVVDPVINPVVDPVIDTVKPVVDGVLGLVENPPGGGQVDPPDLGGGGGSHVSGPPAGEEPPGTQSPADPGGRSVLGGRTPDGAGLTGSAGPTISAASGTAPPADRTFGNRFGEALGGVARSLAIVLTLFGLAVAFVTIQDRLDRSDPRLALAPVESDVVEFA